VKRIIKNFKDIGGKKIKILSDIIDIDEAVDKVNLIVNCTPLGMDIESYKDLMPIPENWNLKKKYIFDMVYNPRETILIKKAKKEGSVIITGMDMLINQAVFSFRVWFGIMPDINVIKEIYNLV
jgi:shikimate dehydrogenase